VRSARRAFFPLDQRLHLASHVWTAETIAKAVRLNTEIPSVRRARENFEGLTHVAMSKTSLNDLTQEYGNLLREQEEEEAEILAKAPGREEEIRPQAGPAAAGETMAVSLDGVMLHLREEGWKEVKVASFSVVEVQGENEKGEPQVHLTQHSYRAGLWEAAVFAKQQWAEGWRRGISKAKRIVSVCDGAAWIWSIILTCYAPCWEIIDWWHAVQKVWDIAFAVYGEGTDLAKAWAEQLKGYLWAGNIRALLHTVRQHWPRGKEMSAPLLKAVGYLFRYHHRMRYQMFRQAGYPVGSGTVESACKVFVEERMCQAGMRWSRPGAQALLALRGALLSDRWDDTWHSLLAPKAA